MILHLLPRDLLEDLWFEVNLELADDIAAGTDEREFILHESDTAVRCHQIGQTIIDRDNEPPVTREALATRSRVVLRR